MNAKTLRIGIIGAGKMGRAHFGAVNEYGAAVTAVQDVHLEAAAALAKGADAPLATSDLDEFFEADLDGVILTTPPPVRIEPVRMACNRGIPLLIEKPPALSIEDGRVCLQLIRESGVTSAIGFQLRYSPLYERLKEVLADRTVHLVRTVCTIHYYLTYSMSPWFLQSRISGGPIAEQAIHLLDCVRFILGNARPVQAHAFGAKNMEPDKEEFDAQNALQMTYELESGAFGVHTNHCGHERFAFDLEVIGPHLRLQANMSEGNIRGYLDGEDIEITPAGQNSLGLDKTGAWLRAIQTGDRSFIRSDYDESMNTLALVEAGVTSLKESRTVRVDELVQRR